jgi:hypothetical protein
MKTAVEWLIDEINQLSTRYIHTNLSYDEYKQIKEDIYNQAIQMEIEQSRQYANFSLLIRNVIPLKEFINI